MAVDPVCRMEVEPARAAAQSRHEGVTYWFCCTGCKRKFDADPARYLTGSSATSPTA